MCLVNCLTYENGLMTINYQSISFDEFSRNHYLLRQQLRQMNFKILKIETSHTDEDELHAWIYTDIPESLSDEMTSAWNTYTTQVMSEI